MRSVRRGERRAFETLVRRHTPGVYHLFVRVLSDRELAADATQEVFLRVHSHVGGFDPRRSFKAWLYAIAWNLARDRLRSRKREASARLVSLDAWRGGGPREGASRDVADPRGRRPDASLESAEEADAVREALARLGPEQRAILVLREFEGLSHDDLAELFRCKVGTVKSRLSRARVELRNALVALRPGWFERPPPTEN